MSIFRKKKEKNEKDQEDEVEDLNSEENDKSSSKPLTGTSKRPIKKVQLSEEPQNDYLSFISYVSEKSERSIENEQAMSREKQIIPPTSNKHTLEPSQTKSSTILKPKRALGDLGSFSEIKNTFSDPNNEADEGREINIQIQHHRRIFVKIALLGDGAVGKTALRRAYLGESFRSEYLLTIGADFALTSTKIGDVDLKFQIWDLAGQPRFSGVRDTYYKGCFGALIIFDRTRPETFSNTLLWLNELWKGNGRGPIPFILLGNKSDLIEDDLRMDKRAERLMATFNQETKQRKGFSVAYLQSSAKSGLNVNKAFNFLGTQILSWLEMQKSKRT